jgi:hypothetical protein
MKWTSMVAVTALLLGVLAGCNTLGRQPSLTAPTIAPPALKAGDTAIITVQLEDRFGIVEVVRAVVKEDTRMKFDLTDDGAAPDKVADDGIWTLQVDVPFMAPPGDFALVLTAYDVEGEEIPVKNEVGDREPLSTTCTFTVAGQTTKPLTDKK